MQRLYSASPGATSLQACALAEFRHWADLVALYAFCAQLFAPYVDREI